MTSSKCGKEQDYLCPSHFSLYPLNQPFDELVSICGLLLCTGKIQLNEKLGFRWSRCANVLHLFALRALVSVDLSQGERPKDLLRGGNIELFSERQQRVYKLKKVIRNGKHRQRIVVPSIIRKSRESKGREGRMYGGPTRHQSRKVTLRAGAHDKGACGSSHNWSQQRGFPAT